MLRVLNVLAKGILFPLWFPILALWWFSALITAPWRMLLYRDSFLGWISDLRAATTGLVGLGMFILIPYTLPTSIVYSIMVPLSSPFRRWILGGVGPGRGQPAPYEVPGYP